MLTDLLALVRRCTILNGHCNTLHRSEQMGIRRQYGPGSTSLYGLIIRALVLQLAWMGAAGTILDVRLVDGTAPTNGRVEINVEGVGWRKICGTSWSMNDVLVTCRELGFTGSQLHLTNGEFGEGTAPFSDDSLFCKGTEGALDECDMQRTTCSAANKVAGAVCHGESYLGCFADDPLNRMFDGEYLGNDDNMTIDYCRTHCNQLGYEYAGLEYGSECYCGAAGTDYTAYTAYDDSECRHACSGNELQTCGGIAKIAVHLAANMATTQSPSVRTPKDLQGSSALPNTVPYGFLTTGSTNKLPVNSPSDSTMTVVYILSALLVLCLVTIIGCLAWNYTLRSRLRKSYDVNTTTNSKHSHHSPGRVVTNTLPYMALSDGRTDHAGYQGLSVQRRAAPPNDMGVAVYSAHGAEEPVYQEPEMYREPSVYLAPDSVCAVNFADQPSATCQDDAFGGNEYEVLETKSISIRK